MTCRWPDGFRCRHCGVAEAFELPRRGLWQCKGCGRQTSVTAGTVLHRTRLPLTVWFWARSEEHTSELQSLMRISYAVFCLKKKKLKLTKCYMYTNKTYDSITHMT